MPLGTFWLPLRLACLLSGFLQAACAPPSQFLYLIGQQHDNQQVCCSALARLWDMSCFRHLPKCFDNVHNLEFKKDDKGDPTKTAVGMYSGEYSIEQQFAHK